MTRAQFVDDVLNSKIRFADATKEEAASKARECIERAEAINKEMHQSRKTQGALIQELEEKKHNAEALLSLLKEEDAQATSTVDDVVPQPAPKRKKAKGGE